MTGRSANSFVYTSIHEQYIMLYQKNKPKRRTFTLIEIHFVYSIPTAKIALDKHGENSDNIR